MTLCSKCQAPIRPVVAVDIDGTLGDYHGHFLAFAEAYVGHALRHNWQGEEEWSTFLGLDKRTYRDIKLAYRQGAQKRSMPVFEGSTLFMKNLESFGIEVWIATTRPYLRLDNIDPDTRFWLETKEIPYDSIIYGENKWEQMLAAVDPTRVICVIDDLREECAKASALGLQAVQPYREHNIRDPWKIGRDIARPAPEFDFLKRWIYGQI